MKMIKINNKLLIIITVFISFLLLSCDIVFKQYSAPDYIVAEIDYPASISVQSPQIGEQMHPGSELLIKWKDIGSIENVDIELYKKNKCVFVIKKRFQNSGEFIWKIPGSIPNSVMYNIRVSNSYKLTEYGESERFSITDQ
jgi:hypothetical protein